MRATHGLDALTEREKQTLRLIVRGHDAKSVARHLDLSVHTINERLRGARRKLAVSSSREAARALLAREGGTPEMLGDMGLGEAAPGASMPAPTAPEDGAQRRVRPGSIIIGVLVMSFLLGLIALTTQPAPAPADPPNPATEAAARRFLTLVDQGRWADSYQLFGNAFRKQNSAKVWADVSEKVRPPLGPVVSRSLLSQQEFPAPPNGYQVVKFRTSFANKADTIETVTLERENGDWRVVAIIVG